MMRSVRFISSSLKNLQRIPSSSGKKFRSQVGIKTQTRTPPPAIADPWKEVKDEASGLTYWWNTQTDETTHLGALKPTLVAASANSQVAQVTPPQPLQPLQQQEGGMMSQLGGMVAQGFAFGVGSSLARSAVNSIFDSGSGSSGDGGDQGGGGDDDDGFDL